MTTTYTTTTDRAAIIRAAYKAKGWSSRDISVKSEYYSMGSSLHVRIKNAAIPFAVVEQIANEHEHIDRDQFGDILSGGNTFVHVSYSHEASEALAARYAPALADAALAVNADMDGHRLFPIGDTGFLLGKGSTGYGFSLWKDSHIQNANEAEHLAITLATALQAV